MPLHHSLGVAGRRDAASDDAAEVTTRRGWPRTGARRPRGRARLARARENAVVGAVGRRPRHATRAWATGSSPACSGATRARWRASRRARSARSSSSAATGHGRWRASSRAPCSGAHPARAVRHRAAESRSRQAGAEASTSVVIMAQIDFPSRVGVWWTSDSWAIGDAQQVARDLESMGYGSLFYGEAYGKETPHAGRGVPRATERLVVGTGIANIHARDPIAAESGGRTLQRAAPRPLRARSRRQPRAARRARSRRHLRQAAGHDARLPRAHGRGARAGRARRGPPAPPRRGARAEDDPAVGQPPTARTPTSSPRQTATRARRSAPTSGSSPSRRSRSATTARPRCAGRTPTSNLLGAAELPELVAAPGLRRVRPRPRRLGPPRRRAGRARRRRHDARRRYRPPRGRRRPRARAGARRRALRADPRPALRELAGALGL